MIAMYLGLEDINMPEVQGPNAAFSYITGMDHQSQINKDWYSMDQYRTGIWELDENLSKPQVFDVKKYIDDLREHAPERINKQGGYVRMGVWTSGKGEDQIVEDDWEILRGQLQMLHNDGFINLSTYLEGGNIFGDEEGAGPLGRLLDGMYGENIIDLNDYTKILRYDKESGKYFFEVLDMWDFEGNYRQKWAQTYPGKLKVDFITAVGNSVNMFDSYEVPVESIKYLLDSANSRSWE